VAPTSRLGRLLGTNGLEEGGPEYGVVVHCWFDEADDGYDCYVACFGDELPTGKPAKKPYVLRYFSTSLAVIDTDKPIKPRP
jgi:hypothetical protein